ncbi:hypothetical protein O3P69_002077 [Scylla paramamosain]|uniref:Uncharacterized protein n=1 Tax=Scylla paramamosain TaxID=85552 RepID=A0AAW0V5Q9_SCYPA
MQSPAYQLTYLLAPQPTRPYQISNKNKNKADASLEKSYPSSKDEITAPFWRTPCQILRHFCKQNPPGSRSRLPGGQLTPPACTSLIGLEKERESYQPSSHHEFFYQARRTHVTHVTGILHKGGEECHQ